MLLVYLLLLCIAVSLSSVDLAVDYSDEPRRPTIKPFSSPKPTTILPFWTNVSTASAPVLLQIPDLATDSSTPVPDSSSKSAGNIHNYLSFLLLTIWYHLFIFYSFFFLFLFSDIILFVIFYFSADDSSETLILLYLMSSLVGLTVLIVLMRGVIHVYRNYTCCGCPRYRGRWVQHPQDVGKVFILIWYLFFPTYLDMTLSAIIIF